MVLKNYLSIPFYYVHKLTQKAVFLTLCSLLSRLSVAVVVPIFSGLDVFPKLWRSCSLPESEETEKYIKLTISCQVIAATIHTKYKV